MELNRETAKKVLAEVDAGARWDTSIGAPASVGWAVRAFSIRLADSWPDADRAAGMRRLAIAQLGSDALEQRAFSRYVVVETVNRILPVTLRTAAQFLPKHSDALELSAKACEAAVDIATARTAAEEAQETSHTARIDASAYAAHATSDYMEASRIDGALVGAAAANDHAANVAAAHAYVAYEAAHLAAFGAKAAYDHADPAAAAHAAADAAGTYAGPAHAYSAAFAGKAFAETHLKVLQLSAQIGLEAMQRLKSQGVEWLDLCEA